MAPLGRRCVRGSCSTAQACVYRMLLGPATNTVHTLPFTPPPPPTCGNTHTHTHTQITTYTHHITHITQISHMAPELLRFGKASQKGDVYSFGIMSEWTLSCCAGPLLPAVSVLILAFPPTLNRKP
jgi:serine/threonine protein kinase